MQTPVRGQQPLAQKHWDTSGPSASAGGSVGPAEGQLSGASSCSRVKQAASCEGIQGVSSCCLFTPWFTCYQVFTQALSQAFCFLALSLKQRPRSVTQAVEHLLGTMSTQSPSQAPCVGLCSAASYSNATQCPMVSREMWKKTRRVTWCKGHKEFRHRHTSCSAAPNTSEVEKYKQPKHLCFKETPRSTWAMGWAGHWAPSEASRTYQVIGPSREIRWNTSVRKSDLKAVCY